MISILLPTRSRPKVAASLISSLLSNSLGEVEILVYLQSDDPSLEEYVEVFSGFGLKEGSSYIVGPHLPTGFLWNQLAEAATGDLLCLMGDDVLVDTQSWDKLVYRAAAAYPDGIYVIGVNDGRSQDLSNLGCPHPIVSRRWKDILGYFVPPMFMHRYLDTYTKDLALALGRYIQLPEVMFRHNKEALMTDNTGKLSRSWLPFDRYMYARSSRYFSADLELLKREVK